MQDLRLPRTARRVTGWTNVIVLAGLAMAGIVFADNNAWGASGLCYLAFSIMLYFLGTAAYRLSPKSPGRIEAHSLLGLKLLDLRDGFTVKRGLVRLTLKAGGKRCRINPAFGKSLEGWLAAQSGSTVSGNG